MTTEHGRKRPHLGRLIEELRAGWGILPRASDLDSSGVTIVTSRLGPPDARRCDLGHRLAGLTRVILESRIVKEVMHEDLLAAKWSVAPLRELIRHIVIEYHDCFRLELPQLQLCMPEAPSTRAGLRTLQQNLEATLAQEEEVLFPAIRKCEEAADVGLDPPGGYASAVRHLVPVVTRTNDQLTALVHEILEQRSGTPSEPLENLAVEVSGHIRLENEILFPRALKLLK
jgi:hemerythrin HHE cation binding domain-containing protein